MSRLHMYGKQDLLRRRVSVSASFEVTRNRIAGQTEATTASTWIVSRSILWNQTSRNTADCAVSHSDNNRCWICNIWLCTFGVRLRQCCTIVGIQ